MGYYSDVAIRIQVAESCAPAKVARTIIDLIKEKDDWLARSAKVSVKPEVSTLTISWDWIKWYESYDGVCLVEDIGVMLRQFIADEVWLSEGDLNFIPELMQFEKDIVGYQFLRLGESWDDCDEIYEGDLNHPLGVIRQIDYDF